MFEETENTPQCFPTDNDVIDCLKNNDFYSNSVVYYVLYKLDNDWSSMQINWNLTIEHVMPQTKTPYRLNYCPEDEYERIINLIWNLTLTDNNSELSNKNFEDKKKILKKNWRVRLTEDILRESIRDKSKILSRTEALANKIIWIFWYPQKNDIPRISVIPLSEWKPISLFPKQDFPSIWNTFVKNFFLNWENRSVDFLVNTAPKNVNINWKYLLKNKSKVSWSDVFVWIMNYLYINFPKVCVNKEGRFPNRISASEMDKRFDPKMIYNWRRYLKTHSDTKSKLLFLDKFIWSDFWVVIDILY